MPLDVVMPLGVGECGKRRRQLFCDLRGYALKVVFQEEERKRTIPHPFNSCYF